MKIQCLGWYGMHISELSLSQKVAIVTWKNHWVSSGFLSCFSVKLVKTFCVFCLKRALSPDQVYGIFFAETSTALTSLKRAFIRVRESY